MTHRIEPDQEYEAHHHADSTTIRIRVTSGLYPGWRDEDRVDVVTVTPDGCRLRPRSIAARQLHDNPARKTGYRLVRNADGSPAGGVR